MFSAHCYTVYLFKLKGLHITANNYFKDWCCQCVWINYFLVKKKWTRVKWRCMFLTLGNCWEGSTPGLPGLAQHCLPPTLPSSLSARAGEIPVFISTRFVLVVLFWVFFCFMFWTKAHLTAKYNTAQEWQMVIGYISVIRRGLVNIDSLFTENIHVFPFSTTCQERAADNIHDKSCKSYSVQLNIIYYTEIYQIFATQCICDCVILLSGNWDFVPHGSDTRRHPTHQTWRGKLKGSFGRAESVGS